MKRKECIQVKRRHGCSLMIMWVAQIMSVQKTRCILIVLKMVSLPYCADGIISCPGCPASWTFDLGTIVLLRKVACRTMRVQSNFASTLTAPLSHCNNFHAHQTFANFIFKRLLEIILQFDDASHM